MTLHITQANIADLETILNLQKECYRAEGELYNEFSIPPLMQTLESIREEFNLGTLFLKGVVEGLIVASVKGYTRNNTTYIGRLMVQEEFQNKKFGQMMMKEIEVRLPDCKRYELFTGFKSVKNISLYQKLGYKEFKWEVANEKVTLVYMEKFR